METSVLSEELEIMYQNAQHHTPGDDTRGILQFTRVAVPSTTHVPSFRDLIFREMLGKALKIGRQLYFLPCATDFFLVHAG